VIAGCGDDPTAVDLWSIEFAESLEVDLATFTELPSGVFYKDVIVGEGEPAAAGSRVDIGVEGWLSDGLEVQSWYMPTNLRVGAAELIEGLDEALIGMRAGGERKVVVPPHLAWNDDNVMVFRLVVMAVR
jgi:FKBP-type peptidyl-prolyl cis-trans isomerase